jgi:hypothetical protein
MAEQTVEVLGAFYGDESFPIEWNEGERELFWIFDDLVGFRNSVTGRGFSSSTRSAAGSVSLGYVRVDQARSSGQRGRRMERV